MCGIFAYNGKQDSIPLLVDGLRNLEYRGYDSAGVFCVNKKGDFFLQKAVGKVSNLAKKVESAEKTSKKYTSGIAHTRWATHGTVTELNTHPHYSNNERFYVVHNGIIENYMEIKKALSKKYKFYSDTDTEVIAKLFENMFDGSVSSTLEKVTKRLVGAYAIVVIDKQDPDVLVGAKLGSPMIVGVGSDGVFLSSDINALSKVATEFTSLEDEETVVIQGGKYNVYSSGEEIEKVSEKIDKNIEAASKGKFDTYTEKEIHEVPNVFKNVMKGRVDFDSKTINNETLSELNEYDIDRIEIIASGSSYFAGVVGASWFKELSSLQTEVRISNEFLYDKFIPSKTTLYIFLSQSGETADVRESLKMVKQKGCLTFGIVNVVGSTISRMCDMGLYCHSGIEVGVASTKNIIGQMGVLLIMAISMGLKRDLQVQESRDLIGKLGELGKKLEYQFENENSITKLAEKYHKYRNFFFLGRNVVYGTAAECSLKLKELTYIHAEAYASGELKHGPLALVGPKFPCVVLNPKGVFREKTISNVKEIKARNGQVIGVITAGDSDKGLYDDIIEVPKVHPLLTPFVCLIPMWLFSVKVAKHLGRDVDKPQNLAKSVTVE